MPVPEFDIEDASRETTANNPEGLAIDDNVTAFGDEAIIIDVLEKHVKVMFLVSRQIETISINNAKLVA